MASRYVAMILLIILRASQHMHTHDMDTNIIYYALYTQHMHDMYIPCVLLCAQNMHRRMCAHIIHTSHVY